MLGRLLGIGGVDVLFVCSSQIDEVWIRLTALRCRERGLKVGVAICGQQSECPKPISDRYRDAGVKVDCGMTLKAAARWRCHLAVTASSGLDRKIFPTRAKSFIHMPHSLASLHMIYPEDAFDGYDALFAAGPQHTSEFAAITARKGLTGRRSFAIGYGKLDLLAHALSGRQPRQSERPLVLIAPSWGSDNLLDRCGVALAKALVAAGFDVVVRPHPLFFLDKAPVVAQLEALQAHNTGVRLESPFDGDDAILEADVLIGDYSGIGFEFAALRRRPVVSVNVGLKIANAGWNSLELQPVEIACRAALGPVVSPDVDTIVRAVHQCLVASEPLSDSAIARFLYGQPGDCADRASEQLIQLLHAHPA